LLSHTTRKRRRLTDEDIHEEIYVDNCQGRTTHNYVLESHAEDYAEPGIIIWDSNQIFDYDPRIASEGQQVQEEVHVTKMYSQKEEQCVLKFKNEIKECSEEINFFNKFDECEGIENGRNQPSIEKLKEEWLNKSYSLEIYEGKWERMLETLTQHNIETLIVEWKRLLQGDIRYEFWFSEEHNVLASDKWKRENTEDIQNKSDKTEGMKEFIWLGNDLDCWNVRWMIKEYVSTYMENKITVEGHDNCIVSCTHQQHEHSKSLEEINEKYNLLMKLKSLNVKCNLQNDDMFTAASKNEQRRRGIRNNKALLLGQECEAWNERMRVFTTLVWSIAKEKEDCINNGMT